MKTSVNNRNSEGIGEQRKEKSGVRNKLRNKKGKQPKCRKNGGTHIDSNYPVNEVVQEPKKI